MDPSRVSALLSELDENEQAAFNKLLLDLQSVGGDINALPEEDQLLLDKLAAGHRKEEIEVSVESDNKSAGFSATISQTDTEQAGFQVSKVPEQSPTESRFGQFVVEQLHQLGQGGSSLADTVRYAFHNKYLPPNLKDRNSCESIYQRYQNDIDALCREMKRLESVNTVDPQLMVGLAWFQCVFQCHQFVETYGDLEA